MGVKISELPAASALAGTEPLPLVQSAETRKATVADIAPVRSVAGKTGAVTLDPADCGAAAASHSHSGYEPALGNPASDGQVLASTAAGVRSWVDGGGSPGLVLLATATASNVTSVDFTSGIDSTYDEYEVHLLNVIPASDSKYLTLRTSSNSGSSYDSTAGNYYYNYSYFSGSTGSGGTSTVETSIYLTNPIGNAANELGVDAVVHLIRPSISQYFNLWWTGMYTDVNTVPYWLAGCGLRKTAAAVNAIRFLFSSGNIASGEFKLYGVKKSL